MGFAFLPSASPVHHSTTEMEALSLYTVDSVQGVLPRAIADVIPGDAVLTADPHYRPEFFGLQLIVGVFGSGCDPIYVYLREGNRASADALVTINSAAHAARELGAVTLTACEMGYVRGRGLPIVKTRLHARALER